MISTEKYWKDRKEKEARNKKADAVLAQLEWDKELQEKLNPLKLMMGE